VDQPGSAARLGDETWEEVAQRPGRILAIALGSLEQHGPQLPLDTDSRIAIYLVDRMAAQRSDVVVGPLIPLGASGEHQGFPGTLSVGTQALAGLLGELVRSARTSFRGMVVVSGHGGNHDALSLASKQAELEGDDLLCFSPHLVDGDAHAGRTETSMLLALDPDRVRIERAAPGALAPLAEIIGELRRAGVGAVSENGVLGDPTGASAQEGRALLEEIFEQLVLAVAERFDA
jgi:creatinine amidohydrolase